MFILYQLHSQNLNVESELIKYVLLFHKRDSTLFKFMRQISLLADLSSGFDWMLKSTVVG